MKEKRGLKKRRVRWGKEEAISTKMIKRGQSEEEIREVSE